MNVNTRKAIYIKKPPRYKKPGKVEEPQSFKNRRGDLNVKHVKGFSRKNPQI